MDRTRINCEIPADLAADLDRYATETGISRTAALTVILREHFAGQSGQLALPAAAPTKGGRRRR